jgi:hypothetical protein
MNRGAHAIRVSDGKLDREAERAREAEADALMHESIDSLLLGYLGGLTPSRRRKACPALARAVLTAYRAEMDSAAVTSLCGLLANELGGDLLAPRRVKHASAHAQFDRLCRSANDGEGA